jgi:hypothetical protein
VTSLNASGDRHLEPMFAAGTSKLV